MNKIKKIFSIIISFTFLLILVACTNNSENSESIANTSGKVENVEDIKDSTQSQDLLDTIIEKGEITIAMEGTWSPFTYHDENDELVGYDVEVGEEIAKRLGVKANFIEGEWDGLLSGLTSGRYDIMINGVDITDERKEAYDFTIPYAYIKTAIIVRDDYDDIKTFEDLNGKNTANTITSTYAALAEEYGANVIGVDDLNQTIELLLSNRIDATLNTIVSFYDYKKEHPSGNIKIAAISENANTLGIPMRKGNEKLLNRINEILLAMKADGTLKNISLKYFGIDLSDINATNDAIKISITVGDNVLYGTLAKNKTTEEIVKQFPITLNMSDLYAREMCYHFGRGAFPIDNLISTAYEVGDIIYWEPMGSFVILYEQNGERFERQYLGHIDSDVSIFKTTGDTSVHFEVVSE